MKKIMLFMIALIPICLLFTVQVSTEYVQASNYISVDLVAFNNPSETINKPNEDPVVLDYPARVIPLSATEKEIIYSSSDESIATVDNKGTITFYKFGKVEIIATSKADAGITTSCIFYVTDNKAHEIKILNKRETLEIKQSFQLETVVLPAEAVDKSVTFTSSNSKVVKISISGKVTAVESGSAVITATTSNGLKDSFTINVNVPLKNISINSDSAIVTSKKELKFPTINYSPANATNKKVNYSSSDTSIASIDIEGNIKFVKAGNVTFTATSEEGNYQTSYSVNSTCGYVISAEIKEEFKNYNIDYKDNLVLDFGYNCYPQDIDSSNIQILSSNENVVKIIDGKLHIIGGGEATITLKSYNGNVWLEDTASVNVKRAVEQIIANNINTSEDRITLNYVAVPSDHTEEIEFSVDSSLASINSRGVLTFVQAGSVNVTLKSTISNITKVITVTYKPNASDYELLEINSEKQEFTLNYRDRICFAYNINVNINNITYSYNNSMFALENNIFRAIKGGTSEIIIDDGTKTIIVNITTIRKAEELYIYDNITDVTNKNIATIRDEIVLSTKVLQNDTTNKVINFSSSNENIASVDKDGKVTFNKAGTVTIIASIDDLVEKVVITSTMGKPSNFDIKVKDMQNINGLKTLRFKDVNLTSIIEIVDYSSPSDYSFNISDFEFSTTNSNIVSVDKNGNIKAIERGNATISIKAGSVVKTLNVTVEVLTKDLDVVYNNGSQEVILADNKIIGNEIALISKVYPENANNQNVEFMVLPDYMDIAEIINGNILRFKDYGEVVVKAMTVDSNGEIYKEIYIERIEKVDDIKIFYLSQDVTNKTISKASSDNTGVVLEVQPYVTNILDPENLDFSQIEIKQENIKDDSGLTTKVVKNSDGVYVVTKSIESGINKKLNTTLTFNYGSLNTASVTIEYNNLKSLDLIYYELNGVKYKLDNQLDKNYGLERKLVFGTYNIINGKADSQNWKVSYTRNPQNNIDKLYWFSSDESIAKVQDGVISFIDPDFEGEKLVTITVSESNDINNKVAVKGSYTFTFVKGINIWNNSDYSIARTTTNGVLHCNLGIKGYDDLDKTIPFDELKDVDNFQNTLYGNGRTINYKNRKEHEDEKITFSIVRNLTIRGTITDEEKNFEKQVSVTQETAYCTFENFRKMHLIPTENLYVKNCYFRYFSQSAIQIGKQTTGNIFIENCIFFDVGKSAIDYQSGELYIKGILDIYNFREPNEIASGALTIAQAAIKNAFENNPGYVETWTTGSGLFKNTHYAANCAIACMPSTVGVEVMTHSVHFYSHNDGEKDVYLANIDKCTGLNYTRLGFDITLGTVYKIKLFIPPLNNKIKYGQTPTKADIDKIARTI